jgi:hypothetical protein
MFEMRPWFLAGILINSALFLVFVVIAGLVEGKHVAVVLGILAMGATYLDANARLYQIVKQKYSWVSWSFPVVISALAWLALLW